MYRARPKSCSYSVDGTEAGRFNFAGLRWRNWGSRTPSARGYLVDNHDQDNNGFQRSRVRIRLLDRVSFPSGRRYYAVLEILGGENGIPRNRVPLVIPGGD